MLGKAWVAKMLSAIAKDNTSQSLGDWISVASEMGRGKKGV